MNKQAIKEFGGSHQSAMKKSAKHLTNHPQLTEESSSYEQGRRGLTHLLFAFIVSLIIGLVLLVAGVPVIVSPVAIGVITLVLFIMKPAGKLTVKYKQTELLKTCPKCAEQIKQAANLCRFCGYDYQVSDSTTDQVSEVTE